MSKKTYLKDPQQNGFIGRLLAVPFIDSKSKSGYSHEDPIKLLLKSIESSLHDYSDAHIFVIGNIAVTKTVAVPAGSAAGT